MTDFKDNFKVDGGTNEPIDTKGDSTPNKPGLEEVNTQLLEKYGEQFSGTKIDDSGNLINNEGTVVKSKDELAELEKGTNNEPEFDTEKLVIQNEEGKDVTYKLDDKGNALNDEGKVIYTKEQIEGMGEAEPTGDGEPNTPFNINDVIKLTNINVNDEAGKPVLYDNTAQGIAKYVNDASEAKGKALSEKGQEDFFKANPDLYQAYLYKVQNGTLKGMGDVVDWGKITLEDDNEAQYMDIIIKAELSRGSTPDKARRNAEYIKADGKAKEEAADELKYLQEKQTNDAATAKKIEDNRIAAENKEFSDYLANIKSIIDSGKIGDFVLPQSFTLRRNGTVTTASRDEFIEYYTKPMWRDTNTGELFTSYEIDEHKLPLPNKLFTALLMFTGGDTSQLVKENINDSKVKTIRRLSVKSTKQTGNVGNTGDAGRKVVIS